MVQILQKLLVVSGKRQDMYNGEGVDSIVIYDSVKIFSLIWRQSTGIHRVNHDLEAG